MSAKVPRRRLTVSLAEADWENLEAEALAHDVKIGTWAARLLTEHVNPSTRDTRIPSTGVDEVTWERVSVWFNAMGITGPMLKAHGCKTKTEALAWAKSQGFDS